MTEHFKYPHTIKDYGNMIEGLNRLMKQMAAAMKTLGTPEDEIEAIIGCGPYNDRQARFDYTLQGSAEYASRRDPKTAPQYSGLFGAFGILHLPELRLAAQLPSLLGKAGCQLSLSIDGKTYNAPLTTLKLRVRNNREKHAALVLAENLTLTAADGTTHILPRDYAIISPANRGNNRPKTYSPDLDPDTPETERCRIIDPSGTPISANVMANILWGQQGAKGMKQRDVGDRTRDTLMLNGTDDDFTAEDAMVKSLAALKADHRLDFMPNFREFVENARVKLLAHPDYLAAIVAATREAQVCTAIAQNHPIAQDDYQFDPRSTSLLETMHTFMGITREDLANIQPIRMSVATTLQQKIPEMEEAERLEIKAAEDAKEVERRKEKEKNLLDLQKELLSQITTNHARLFDLSLWQRTTAHPNQLRKDGERAKRICGFLHTNHGISPEQALSEAFQVRNHQAIVEKFSSALALFSTMQDKMWPAHKAEGKKAEHIQRYQAEMTEATQALRAMVAFVQKNNQSPPDFEQNVEKIRTVVRSFNTLFSNQENPSTHRQVFRKQASALKERWKKIAPDLNAFCDIMQTLKYDGAAWLRLYGNCDHLLSRVTPAQGTPATTVEAERSHEGGIFGVGQAASDVLIPF